MNYFRFLSILLGSLMLASGIGVVLFKSAWEKAFLKIYPEKRPSWLLFVGGAVLVWVLATWWAFFQAASMFNFVVTLAVSLGLVKAAPLIFFYEKSRHFLKILGGEPLAFRVVMLSSASVGAALLIMGLFF